MTLFSGERIHASEQAKLIALIDRIEPTGRPGEVRIYPAGYNRYGENTVEHDYGTYGPIRRYRLPEDVRLTRIQLIMPANLAQAALAGVLGIGQRLGETGERATFLSHTNAYHMADGRTAPGQLDQQPGWVLSTDESRDGIVWEREDGTHTIFALSALGYAGDRSRQPAAVDNLVLGRCQTDEFHPFGTMDPEHVQTVRGQVQALMDHITSAGELRVIEPTAKAFVPASRAF